ncbi:MAG: rod shape-determining protein MreC [Lachnospiraceae bacterium]|nr:rod shape-determining protein MreC [Lachnospiraceae bacterium]
MRRKRQKFTIPSKYLLLIMTVICVLFMAITFFTDFFAAPLSNFAGAVVIPFQSGVSRIGEWMSDRSEELDSLKNVLAENDRLQEQVDALTIENNSLQQDKYELNNLRQLYKLDQEYAEFEKVGARVVAKDSGNWFHTFVINKGSKDGIQIDMNVMAGSGLVGRVTEVGNDWAKVLSIIDDNSNVSATVLSTEDSCMVQGNLETMEKGVITFSKLVNGKTAVKEGDKVVTSHISTKYLPGILIGYISAISADANNLTSSGYLTPAVDFAHLEEVLVITDLKKDYSEEGLKK